MKLNNNYSQYNNNPLLTRKRNINAQKDQSKENMTTNRPAEAISFGGSAGSLTKSFVNSKRINGLIEKVYDNEAAFNAIYSLLIAGIIKPLFVLNMPGSEDKDKQIVATKNFLQAFLGSFLGLTIGGGFVKKAVDIVKRNLKLISKIDGDKITTIDAGSEKALKIAKEALEKEHSGLRYNFKQAISNTKGTQGGKKVTKFLKTMYEGTKYEAPVEDIALKAKELVKNFDGSHKTIFEKNPKFVKLLISKAADSKSNTLFIDGFETFWKNSTGALTAIGKAKISSLLLPGVMAFLFAKRNLENARKEKAKGGTLTSNQNFKDQQEQFQKLLNKNNNQVSFKGNVLNTGIEGFSKLIEKAGMSKVGEACSNALTKTKKPSARMGDLESILLTCYWLVNTHNSKKIEPSQKLGLNIHTALVTLVSSTVAFLLDWSLDGLIDKAKGVYKETLQGIANSIETEGIESPKSIIENLPPIAQMSVSEKAKELLAQAKQVNGKIEIDKPKIEEAVKFLNKSNIFTNNGVKINIDTLENFINALKKALPIEEEIKEKSKNLVGSKTIAKKLSQAIANNDLDGEIKALTGSYGKKLSKFKSLTVFTLVVRFLVPVVMVPFSGKLKKKIVEMTNKKEQNQQQISK